MIHQNKLKLKKRKQEKKKVNRINDNDDDLKETHNKLKRRRNNKLH